MDKALYVAMTGARASLQAQGTLSHNLANTDTPGFKEALANTEAFPIKGTGYASRTDALHVDAGFNRRMGAQQITGNPLDLSLQAGNWLAVQAPGANAGEAYTRGAALSITPNGQLVTAGGHPVLDENSNPIAIPPHQAMDIGNDGTISIIPLGEGPQTMANVGRIRVVQAIVGGEPVSLIETLCDRLVTGLHARFTRAVAIEVTVHKPEAPIRGTFLDVGVTMRRQNPGFLPPAD